MTDDQQERSKRGWEAAGVAVPAGLLIGMGVGWLFDHMVPGLFIGLGAGMLVMGIIRLAVNK
jgi:hypothetical protein